MTSEWSILDLRIVGFFSNPECMQYREVLCIRRCVVLCTDVDMLSTYVPRTNEPLLGKMKIF